ncbi:MAG: peptidylprolyl isomerase [Opitutaceae bacterium]|nr:peptidylprolyl isomerase [Opitutaceae bacterium]
MRLPGLARLRRLITWIVLAAPLAAVAAEAPLPDGLYAEFTTPRGTFVAELHYREAPMTVAHFVGLAEGSLGPNRPAPYYTGLQWYRVVPGFVIQSGNPAHPRDTNPGPTFPDEMTFGLRHGEAGVLSMANLGPDTNAAEFFVTLGDCTRLDFLHSVFGRTVRGREVLPRIEPGDALNLRILRVGAMARAFPADAAAFQALVARAGRYRGETEPGPSAHFDDPQHLIPPEPPRARNFNFKLANLERFTGLRIAARLMAKSPSAAEDAQPGAYMRALAERLGVARRGALAVYFADEDDWRVWIGDESTAAFLGRTPSAADLSEGAAFHEAKEAFLQAARAAGDARFATEQKAAPPDQPPPAGQRLKLQTDAMLDGLIRKLSQP